MTVGLRKEKVDIASTGLMMEAWTPGRIVEWVSVVFGNGAFLSTAFGPAGCVLIHTIAEQGISMPVVFIDTGYHFDETLRMLDVIKGRYGIEVEVIRPTATQEEYERIYDGALHIANPDKCCFDRKVAVFSSYARRKTVWISAILRSQTPSRGNARVFEWNEDLGVFKVNPLIEWTVDRVWREIAQKAIPTNPLFSKGFSSVGCAPCTKQTKPGETERMGRWPGHAKTECGLHRYD